MLRIRNSQPAGPGMEQWTPEKFAEVTDASGTLVRMSREVQKPIQGDLISFTHTFTSPRWDHPQVSHSTLRFLDANSLRLFLSEAGLEIAEQYGDWNRQALTADSPEIITFAKRTKNKGGVFRLRPR